MAYKAYIFAKTEYKKSENKTKEQAKWEKHGSKKTTYFVVASSRTTAIVTITSSTKAKQWIMNLRSVTMAMAISLAGKYLAPTQSVPLC